jgi:hypothetical protein
MNNRLLLFSALLLMLVTLVYRAWLKPDILAAGDWVYFYPDVIREIVPFAAWDWRHNGLGGTKIPTLWVEAYFATTAQTARFIPWAVYERLFWFFPFLILGTIASYQLFVNLFKQKYLAYIASFIYICNTYILMVVSGGQVGSMVAYAFAPLILRYFIATTASFENKLPIQKSIKTAIFLGILLALQALFDMRFTYITFFALFLYWIVGVRWQRVRLLHTCLALVIPAIVLVLMHAFWLYPVVMLGNDSFASFGSAYTSMESVKFFSFATFENTLSLLHPNWPENIFGKVTFMRPEFLLIPLLAYVPLAFITTIQDKLMRKYVLYFSLLGLLGAFLAKGANEPFGDLYLWFFTHVPGFVLFRDSTKWYVLVALAYSILIPLSVSMMLTCFKGKSSLLKKIAFGKYIPGVVITSLIIYVTVLLSPAFLGNLPGTLRGTTMPQEYKTLSAFLQEQDGFFRTFWVPSAHRLGYASATHPKIDAREYYGVTDPNAVIKRLAGKGTQEELQRLSVKYVVIPYDSEGEIFLTNRKFYQKLFSRMATALNKIPWLKNEKRFGNVVVYEVANHKDRFFVENDKQKIVWRMEHPTKYVVTTNGNRIDSLLFSERYDSNWVARYNGRETAAVRYEKTIMKFPIQDSPDEITIIYKPQTLVDQGASISAAAWVGLITSIFVL